MTVARSASRTDVGQRRSHNEDALLERPPLFAIADGVGGAAKGEVASAGALEVVARHMPRIVAATGPDAAAAELAEAVEAANTRVHEAAHAVPESAGMATTLTAALVRPDGTVVLAHVGDSRAYRIGPAGPAVQLTDDHSVVGELLRSGRIDDEEAMHHPQRNVITRAVGPEAFVQVDTSVLRLPVGTLLLLCSDGLTGHLDAHEIADVVRDATSARRGGELDAAAGALVDAANARGGLDNITVVLVELGAPTEQPGSPLDRVNPASISGELRIDPMLLRGAGADHVDVVPDGPDLAADLAATHTAFADDVELAPQALPPRRERRRERRANRTDEDRAQASRRRRLAALRTLSVLVVVVLLVFAVGTVLWQRSYFLVERGDGTLGIDQGFPVAHLHRHFQTSDTIVSTLTDSERDRLLERTSLHSRHDAERLLDEAGSSGDDDATPPAPSPSTTTGTTTTATTATTATATTATAPVTTP